MCALFLFWESQCGGELGQLWRLTFYGGKMRKRARDMEVHQGGRTPLEWVDEGARVLGRPCSIAEVRFSPVQTPFPPNLNLNLIQNVRTWTELEPWVRFGFEPSEPCDFFKSDFSISFRVQTLWNTCPISRNKLFMQSRGINNIW